MRIRSTTRLGTDLPNVIVKKVRWSSPTAVMLGWIDGNRLRS
jgi:hypothetical protein